MIASPTIIKTSLVGIRRPEEVLGTSNVDIHIRFIVGLFVLGDVQTNSVLTFLLIQTHA